MNGRHGGAAGTKPALRSMQLRLPTLRALWVWSKSRPEGVHGKRTHTPPTSLLRCLNPNCTKFTSFTCSQFLEEAGGTGGQGRARQEGISNTTYSVQHLISELHCQYGTRRKILQAANGIGVWRHLVAENGL